MKSAASTIQVLLEDTLLDILIIEALATEVIPTYEMLATANVYTAVCV